MFFKRIEAPPDLANYIKCYWIIEKEDSAVSVEKIIPDGYTEIIFHYREPYKIKLAKQWHLQSKRLLAGQIHNHFFLQNTGASGIVGVKFQPTALTHLFDLNMINYTDKVVDLESALGEKMKKIKNESFARMQHDEVIEMLSNDFRRLISKKETASTHADRAVEMIVDKNGSITVEEIIQTLNISERHLERQFKKYVGISPKFYARIIRFGYIFEHIADRNFNWNDIAFESGFYDQSHFIKNFKSFTGENPTHYYFHEANMANFFLKRE